MTQVRSIVSGARVAITPGIDRLRVLTEASRLQVHLAFVTRPGSAVSGVAGRRDAVEKVASSRDGFEQVVGVPDAHEVPRLVGWKKVVQHVERAPHIVFGLAHAQPADPVSGPGAEIHESERMISAQIVEDVALEDGKERLFRNLTLVFDPLEAALTPLQPRQRPTIR